MGNRHEVWALGVVAVAAAAVVLLAVTTVRRAAFVVRPPASNALEPTVASITPAGTDVLLGIGAAAHLVAVCDRDEDRPGTAGLPRVGDFDHVDWEKLAAAGPKILVTQFGGRMPAGLKDRCDQLGIRLIDVRLNVLDDIYREADVLAAALHEEANERKEVAELKARLAAVASATAGLPHVRTALSAGDGGSIGLIGAGTFHDEILTLVGGENVAAKFGKPYVSVDAEQLSALAPDVVLDLEPTPPTTPQQLDQSRRFWAAMPDLPAVKARRVYPLAEPYSERPGWHVAELAEVFATKLHPGIPAAPKNMATIPLNTTTSAATHPQTP